MWRPRMLDSDVQRVSGAPPGKGAGTDREFTHPFLCRLRSAAQRICELGIVPSVVLLLGGCGPPAVTGFVVPIVVDPIDGMESPARGALSWGTRPHVGDEVLEGLPSGADRNPPGAVILELRVMGVLAAAFQLRPGGVFGGPLHAMFSVRPSLCCTNIALVAPAGFALAAQKYVAGDGPRFPAYAERQPFVFGAPSDGPSLENITHLNLCHRHTIRHCADRRKEMS